MDNNEDRKKLDEFAKAALIGILNGRNILKEPPGSSGSFETVITNNYVSIERAAFVAFEMAKKMVEQSNNSQLGNGPAK